MLDDIIFGESQNGVMSHHQSTRLRLPHMDESFQISEIPDLGTHNASEIQSVNNNHTCFASHTSFALDTSFALLMTSFPPTIARFPPLMANTPLRWQVSPLL